MVTHRGDFQERYAVTLAGPDKELATESCVADPRARG